MLAKWTHSGSSIQFYSTFNNRYGHKAALEKSGFSFKSLIKSSQAMFIYNLHSLSRHMDIEMLVERVK